PRRFVQHQTQMVLLMLTGGGNLEGIHGKHLSPGVEIHYAASDVNRRTIPWVEYRNRNTGAVRTFLADGSTSQSIRTLSRYEMQCVDCHNRPTHTFELPETAVDEAMGLGRTSPTLPFLKKKAVELLKAKYASNQEAGPHSGKVQTVLSEELSPTGIRASRRHLIGGIRNR
ncbi:MAG TPA: hypothetical protein VG498_02035, partial [Terriglobales bacterium]|nr:hypothetical protein [Terriglobales bacterium]